jgi:hypothetical protein
MTINHEELEARVLSVLDGKFIMAKATCEIFRAYLAKCEEVRELRAALKGTLERYVDLAESGDCGFWDPEEKPHVIAARKALEAK